MNTAIVIPALDPNEKLVSLASGLLSQGFSYIVVVDDGSSDSCASVFDALKRMGVRVVHHAANLGKGAALKTGIADVRSHCPLATHIVTADADGQHTLDDICRVSMAAEGHHDHIVLGVRDLRSPGVPVRSRVGNAFSSAYFKFDTGVSCSDTQTGLRAMPLSLAPLALSTPGTRFEYEMNFLTSAAKRSIPMLMIPIAAVYENKNSGSHFSTVRDSVRIYRQLARFAGSSIACACVDLGLFALMAALVNLNTALLIAAATIVARMCSGMLNFVLNRFWSFSDAGSGRGDARGQVRRYGVLFLAQMLASAGLVWLFSALPLPIVAVKMLVDGSLFVVSYFVQRNWVFKGTPRSKAVVMKGGAAHVAAVSKSPYKTA